MGRTERGTLSAHALAPSCCALGGRRACDGVSCRRTEGCRSGKSHLTAVAGFPPRMLQVCAVDFTAYHMLRPLMHGARDAGWSVEFACAPGQWAEALSAEGFRFRRIPVSRAVSPPTHLRSIAILGASI